MTGAPDVVVLDYGSGNLRSASRALERVGARVEVTADLRRAREADGLVVPGVGAFEACVRGVREVGGDVVVRERLADERPVLGICVGMQVLFDRGVEHGVPSEGLRVLPGSVERLDAPVVPHMGWNTVAPPPGSVLLDGLEGAWFYFVHSYAARSAGDAVVGWAEHGEPFVATAERGSLSATAVPPGEVRGRGARTCWSAGPPRSDVDSTSRAGPSLASRPCSSCSPPSTSPAGRPSASCRGRPAAETTYGDPLDAALAWQEGGASWVHLVDLDAAFGRGSNAEQLARVVGRLDVDVELSGGVRDDASLERALATGCRRVNLGTAALESPGWVRDVVARHGDLVAVGLDVRGTTLAARGWTSDGGELYDVLARLDADGCARYVVTDVRRDGTLTGPNLDLLRDVCAATDRPVVASGGVSTLDDLRALAALEPLGGGGRRRRQGALRGGRSPCPTRWPPSRTPRRERRRPARGAVPGRRRRPGRQGRELHRAAGRGRPGGAGPPLRRAGRRRVGLPGHHRQQLRPRDHLRRRATHGRAGVHPADGGRGGAGPAGRGPAAARRGGQGRGEHRGGGRPGAAGPAGGPVRLPVRGAVGGRPPGGGRPADPQRVRGDHARRAPRHGRRRGGLGPPGRGAGGGGGAAELHGRRRHQGRLRPGDAGGGPRGGGGARGRQRGEPVRWSTSRPRWTRAPTPCSPPACSTSGSAPWATSSRRCARPGTASAERRTETRARAPAARPSTGRGRCSTGWGRAAQPRPVHEREEVLRRLVAGSGLAVRRWAGTDGQPSVPALRGRVRRGLLDAALPGVYVPRGLARRPETSWLLALLGDRSGAAVLTGEVACHLLGVARARREAEPLVLARHGSGGWQQPAGARVSVVRSRRVPLPLLAAHPCGTPSSRTWPRWRLVGPGGSPAGPGVHQLRLPATPHQRPPGRRGGAARAAPRRAVGRRRRWRRRWTRGSTTARSARGRRRCCGPRRPRRAGCCART